MGECTSALEVQGGIEGGLGGKEGVGGGLLQRGHRYRHCCACAPYLAESFCAMQPVCRAGWGWGIEACAVCVQMGHCSVQLSSVCTVHGATGMETALSEAHDQPGSAHQPFQHAPKYFLPQSICSTLSAVSNIFVKIKNSVVFKSLGIKVLQY